MKTTKIKVTFKFAFNAVGQKESMKFKSQFHCMYKAVYLLDFPRYTLII